MSFLPNVLEKKLCLGFSSTAVTSSVTSAVGDSIVSGSATSSITATSGGELSGSGLTTSSGVSISVFGTGMYPLSAAVSSSGVA